MSNQGPRDCKSNVLTVILLSQIPNKPTAHLTCGRPPSVLALTLVYGTTNDTEIVHPRRSQAELNNYDNYDKFR